MEPPKKRKYPMDDSVAGECDNTMLDTYVVDQMDVVSGGMGVQAKRNRRSYSLEFKVSVLDGYYHDPQTRLNQRKTALKYGVNRRQIQKWLAQEDTLRGSVGLDPRNVDKTTLSTYLNYQTKINYLRRMEGGPAEKVEVTPEFEQEEDFVIDERENYESLPINLSKGDSSIKAMRDDRIVPIIKVEHNQTPHTISSFPSDISPLPQPTPCPPQTVLCHRAMLNRKEAGRYGETPAHHDTSLHHDTNLNQDTMMHRTTQDTMMLISPQDTKHHMSIQDTTLHQSSATQRDTKIVVGQPLSPPKLDVSSTHAEDSRGKLLEVSSRDSRGKPQEMSSRSENVLVSATILDTSTGMPGRGVRLTLYREVQEDVWAKVNNRVTDKNGRATDLINWEDFYPGIYKIKFYTGEYFKSTNRESCHPYVEVAFQIKIPSQRHHVSLHLSPYGYYTSGA